MAHKIRKTDIKNVMEVHPPVFISLMISMPFDEPADEIG
jgi:hypothetical protein